MYRVGRVLRASGLKGEVRIQLFRPRRETLAGGGAPSARGLRPGKGPRGSVSVELDAPDPVAYAVESVRFVDPTNAVVRLTGVTDRDTAEALHGGFVIFDPDALPPSLADEADRAFGARAVDADTGAPLGLVASIQDNGAQPILVLTRELEPATEHLVPFVDAFIAGIDHTPSGRVVRIHVIPGLFDVETSADRDAPPGSDDGASGDDAE
ncbi:hypothetical protein L6R52_42250 [Myxococcota bacterium]|nr:hypothetical protein [Myxococcota bacterium]